MFVCHLTNFHCLRLWNKYDNAFYFPLFEKRFGYNIYNLFYLLIFKWKQCIYGLIVTLKNWVRNNHTTSISNYFPLVYAWCYRENHSSCFLIHILLKAKVWLPNLNFHHFSCHKQLIHSKKHVKSVYVSSLEKIVESLRLSSGLISSSVYLTLFSAKPRNVIITLIWYCV